jgi:membrane-associated phospholipid phosphatase
VKFLAARWVTAGVLLVACALLYAVAVGTAAGQTVDIRLFSAAQAWNPTLEPLVAPLRPGIPVVLAVACGAAAAVRLWRAAPGPVVRVGVGVGVTVAVALLLKRVLERPYLGDAGYVENTYPSGHVAVSAALALALLTLCSPAAARALVLPVALVVAAACVVNVVGHAHRPADTLGALLLAAAVHATVAPARARFTRPVAAVHP